MKSEVFLCSNELLKFFEWSKRLFNFLEVTVVVLEVDFEFIEERDFFLWRNMMILSTLRKFLGQLIRRCQNKGRRLVIAAMIRLQSKLFYNIFCTFTLIFFLVKSIIHEKIEIHTWLKVQTLKLLLLFYMCSSKFQLKLRNYEIDKIWVRVSWFEK